MAQLADEVVTIHHERLIAHETLAVPMARAGGGSVVRSPDAERLAEELRRAGLEVSGGDVGGDGLVVAAPAERVGEVAAAAGIVLHELRPQGASLEEVFLALTAEEDS